MSCFSDLTDSQREAVEHVDGPLLVVAGPGSGKTRVITRRIAHLISRGVSPRAILAITFTNRSAGEMADRVGDLVAGGGVWVSTFHKFCSSLLRRYAPHVGLQSNFSIFGTTDQRQLIRQVLHELDFDAVHSPPAQVGARISRAKNAMIGPEHFEERFQASVGDHLQAVVARVYPEYQKWLLKSNAVDFDDLLLHVVTLLSENPELRRDLDARYRYVLVDEYQDTNLVQYRIVQGLSQDAPNLCVTGDPDQSIYGWRGARLENILSFEADFPDAKVVRLEQNFRSTREILKTADELIAHNQRRKIKSLLTDDAGGRPVELLTFSDGKQEADVIARRIRTAVESSPRKWSDFALFYRVNSLSRELELALSRHRIPYQVAAGVAFYERAEVKDLLAYLRVIHNPADDTAFRRIVNTPLRGIGKTTLGRLANWAESGGTSLMEAAKQAGQVPRLSKRAVAALKSFESMLSRFSLASSGSVEDLLVELVERTRYTAAWQGSTDENDVQRLSNVSELVVAARQYDRLAGDARSLEGFLEAASLAGDQDDVDEAAGKVTLMTLHAAKGLEFPVVFITALEQNLLPHERALREMDLRELEEERRLLFVGITRAMRELFLTQTRKREIHGRSLHTIRSEFLTEIDVVETDCSNLAFETESLLVAPQPDSAKRKSQIKEKRPLLTTGAALLNGTGEAAAMPLGFKVGMQVRHPRYGVGCVVEVGGFGPRRSVTVEFENGQRTETFVASRCPLQPVGMR